MNTRSDLRAYLRTLDTETLVDLLCAQAERDPELRGRLDARQVPGHGDPAGRGGVGAGLAEVSDLLDDAAEAADTAHSIRVSSVLDTLERLLDAGTSADVGPLARRVVDTLLGARDADGPGVDDLLPRAVRLYARACAAHPPPAATLAGWFTTVAFDRPGWPDIDLAEFAEPLGDEGIRHVRATVDRVLCERGVDASDPRRQTARRLRLEIAEACGDVDTVVRLLSERLPRVDVSLKIVRVLRAAGRHTEAIAHAAAALRNAGHEDGDRRGSMVEALERLRAHQATDAATDPVVSTGTAVPEQSAGPT
ncbi:hypothetical protein, partial [Saccharomonospora iraqiensis]|uniref:hypothetical protein n=1 Tax=Saccharomonospora iraqiensis TaxID=52698 RepID=UPI00047C8ABE